MSLKSCVLNFFYTGLLSLVLAGSLWAEQVTWNLDNLESIGGFATTTTGDPSLVETPYGTGIQFDGNDGLIVDINPLANEPNFTMEMILRPEPNANPTLDEPRILHIQTNTPNDHRAILEGRITGNQWYVDGFLRGPNPANPSSVNALALIDENKLHAADRWYTYAMVYDGSEMRVYVDGQLEHSGEIAITSLAAGQVSIGMRHNVRNFFTGDIYQVRFTPEALAAEQLLSARLPGDFNGDAQDSTGGIDSRDLDVWQAQFGSASNYSQLGDNADANGDGLVNGSDFVVWQQSLTDQPAASLQPLPEPSTLMYVLLSLGILGRRVAI